MCMKNKLTKLISVILIACIAQQGVVYAQPDAYYCLRTVAFDERNGGVLPGPREEGIRRQKERLANLDCRTDDLYIVMADLDYFSRFNKIYSKILIGVLGEPRDPDVIYSAPDASIFKRGLTTVASACRAVNAEVYQHLAGDELTIQCNSGDPYEVNNQLNAVRDWLLTDFHKKLAVAKIHGAKKLSAKKIKALSERDEVLSIVQYGLNYYVLVKNDKDRDLADQLSDLSEGLSDSEEDRHSMVPYEYRPGVPFKGGIMPSLTVSLGAMSARGVIEKLEAITGEDLWDRTTGRLKEKYVDMVYEHGVHTADDMLYFAKRTRNTVHLSDSVEDVFLNRPIQVTRSAEKEERDRRLKELDNQDRFRRAVKPNDNLVTVEVSTYNGKLLRDEGGFHAVNGALGHDNADIVIDILQDTIRKVFARHGLSTDNMCRLTPPDKFAVALSQDIDEGLLRKILHDIRREVQAGLQNLDAGLSKTSGKQFGFDVRLKVSAVSADEVRRSKLDMFREDRLGTVEVISKLEKAAEMVSTVDIKRAVILHEIEGVGETRIFSADEERETPLVTGYWLVQERERMDGIENWMIREMVEMLYRESNTRPLGPLLNAIKDYMIQLKPVIDQRTGAVSDTEAQTSLRDQIQSFMESLKYPPEGYYPKDNKSEYSFLLRLYTEIVDIRERFKDYKLHPAHPGHGVPAPMGLKHLPWVTRHKATTQCAIEAI